MKRYKFILVAIGTSMLFSFLTGDSAAQRRKTAARANTEAIELFVGICAAYKTRPLQMQLTIKNAADIAGATEDTASFQVMFTMQQEGTMVTMPGVEQHINDSLMLLVHTDLKQMMLFRNTPEMTRQVQRFSGDLVAGSTVEELRKHYNAGFMEERDGNAGVWLKSRSVLPGNPLPKNEVTLVFSNEKRAPVSVTQLTRSLVLIDSTDYQELLVLDGFKEKLLNTAEGLFVIKESTSTYLFDRISHDRIALPARMSNRIMQTGDGDYMPVKEYQEYVLHKNF